MASPQPTSTRRARSLVPAVLGVLVVVVASLLVAGGLFADDDVRDASAPAADASAPERGAGTGGDGVVNADDAGGLGSAGTEGVAAARSNDLDPNDDVIVEPNVVLPDLLPVEASSSNTVGLADGDTVTIRVRADEGPQIFALEARLCAGGAAIVTDSDMRPSRTGKCVSAPLSADTDSFVEARFAPPFQEGELVFRVGVGAQSYTTQDGDPITITCDRDHPCSLAVKFQIPNGYGFRTYPLEYR